MNTSELYFNTPVIDKAGNVKYLSDFGGGGGEKPHGEYVGNGSTTERVIETGVADAKMILLNAIAISTGAVTGSSIVFESGAIKFSAPTVAGMNATNVKIDSGNIVLHTSDANFNAGSNLRYEWYVIL